MDENIEVSDYIFKIIAVGDAGVGKTSLTIRYATQKFSEDYRMTLGMNLITKNIKLQKYSIQLAIWDVAGQPTFESILPMYYRGALGAIVVYDLTKRKTFENIERWVTDLKKHCDEIPLVIIGNKKDLDEQIEISTEEGQKIAERIKLYWKRDVHFVEASAKEDLGVEESFDLLSESVLKMIEEQEENEEENFEFL